MMHDWWDYSGPWHGFLFGPLMMILFIVATVLLVAWLLRLFSLGWHAKLPEQTALDVLKMRLARGEIDRAEYDERKKLLLEK